MELDEKDICEEPGSKFFGKPRNNFKKINMKNIHVGQALSIKEVLAQRSSKYEFIDTDMKKESPESKQETLEEAGLKHCQIIDEFPALENALYSFKQGAKWQEQRMYSEEEVIAILAKHTDHIADAIDFDAISNATTAIPLPEWDDKRFFEQFKKK